MVMEEKDLQKLHSAVSTKFDIGDYDAFKSKMQTPEQRKSFYDKVSERGFDLGDYDSYESRLKKKEETDVGETAPSGFKESFKSFAKKFFVDGVEKDTVKSPYIVQSTQEDIPVNEIPITTSSDFDTYEEFVGDLGEDGVGKDMWKGFSSSGLRTLGGIVGVPQLIDRSVGRWFVEPIANGLDLNDDQKTKLQESLLSPLFGVGQQQKIGLMASEKLQKQLNKSAMGIESTMREIEGGIGQNIKEGDWEDAGRLLARGVAQTIPYLALTAVSAGGGTAAVLTTIGSTAASQRLGELDEMEGLDESQKLQNAWMYGGAEALGELVTAGILNKTAKAFRMGNVSKAYIDRTAKSFAKEMAKDFGLEGSSEAITTMTQNAIDVLTEVDPERGIMDGVFDSGIIGGVVGQGSAGARYVGSRIADAKQAKQVQDNLKSIHDLAIQKIDIDDPTVSEKMNALKTKLTDEINGIIKENSDIASRMSKEDVIELQKTYKAYDKVNKQILQNGSTGESLGNLKDISEELYNQIQDLKSKYTKEAAKEELAKEQQPVYEIEGEKFDSKDDFLQEVSKYAGKEESPKITVKNDEKTADKVADILTPKEEKDALRKEEVQEVKEQVEEEVKPEKEEPQKPKYEEFKQNILKDEENLLNLAVDLKVEERKAARQNLLEGKDTKQAQILEQFIKESYDRGQVEMVEFAAGKKTGKVAAPIEEFVKKPEPTEQEVYEQYVETRAKEEVEPVKEPEEGKRMAQRAQVMEDVALLAVGETKTKEEAQAKVKQINEILNKSQNQKEITAFENKVIRSRIEKAVGGTQYQMNQALEYADKIVNNAEFRAKEKEKYDNISKIKKEVKGIVDKKAKYMRVKETFNVPEAADVVNEYKKLTEEDLVSMTNEEVTAVLEEIRDVKGELKEKAKKRIEEKKKVKESFVARAIEAFKPVGKMKPEQIEYIEEGIIGKPKKAKRRSTFDRNLTSAISVMAARSKEPGKVGRDYLNQELYYGKLVPAERQYKKHLKQQGDKTLDFIKREYKKDPRDVMAEMNEETVTIPVKVKTGEVEKIVEREITKEQAIKWYMLLQDPTLSARIFEPMSVRKDGSVIRGNGFTDETVNAIEKSLTSSDKKLANHLFDQYQSARDRYNEFMRDRYGINLPENPYYSNIYSEYFSDTETVSADDMMQHNPVGTLKANNVISRIANKNTIKDVGALSAYFDYMDKMEWMYQFSEPLEMYRSVFRNPRVRRLIETSYGKDMVQLFDDYESIIMRDFRGMSEKSIDIITKNFARSALGLNPNITVKQLFSTVAAMTEVNPAQFTKELASLAIDVGKAAAGKKNIVSELAGRDSITMRGDVGLGMDVFLSPKIRKSKFAESKILNATAKLLEKGAKLAGKTIEFGDKGGALIGGYTVYKSKYNNYIKKGFSKEEAKQRALRDFDRFVDATQQSMSMFNTSMTRFKTGSLGRAISAFTSAPAQLTRLEMNMWRNVATGLTKKGQFSNKEVLKNLARIAVIRQVIPMLYQLAADGWEWDRENQKAAAILGNLQGVFLLGKGVEKLKNELTGSKFDVPALPIVDNIQEMITITMDAVDLYQYPELYNAKEKKDILNRFSNSAGLVFGVPVRSIKKLVKGDIKGFFEGYQTDKEEMAQKAIEENEPIEKALIDRYGRDFVFDEDGRYRRSTRGYIEEYIYQQNEEMYGDYAQDIRKVMDMRDGDDIKKYLKKRSGKMDYDEFITLLMYLTQEHKRGEDMTIRFISENMANDVLQMVNE
jgi:hypothetical protein